MSAMPSAWAGNFIVSPVNLSFKPGARSASVLLSSKQAQPLAVRVKLLAWNKVQGEDQLSPTLDLVVTPPIVRLEPGATQLIRIGRPAAGMPVEIEKTYRLVLTEIPLQDAAPVPGRIQTRMEISMPVFVPPARGGAVQLLWRAQPMPQGVLMLAVENTGSLHSQLKQLRVRDAGGQLIAQREDMFYTLPRQISQVSVRLARPLRAGERLNLEFTQGTAAARASVLLP